MTALWDIPHLREMQASPVWGDHFIPGEVRVPYQLLQLEEFHNKVTLLFFLWAYFMQWKYRYFKLVPSFFKIQNPWVNQGLEVLKVRHTKKQGQCYLC